MIVIGLAVFLPGRNEQGGTQSSPIAASHQRSPSDNSGWVDVLPNINPDVALAGQWRLVDGELTVNRIQWARIHVSVDVPDEYDFEVTFTRNSGSNSIALIFARGNHQATLDIDAWGRNLAGFQNIDGETCEVNATGVSGYKLNNGQRYTARLAVRRDRVEAFLNDQLITTYDGDGSNLSLIPQWKLPSRSVIGLGAYDSSTTFHSTRIRSVESNR